MDIKNRRIKALVANIAYSAVGARVVSILGITNLFAGLKVVLSKRSCLRIAKKEYKKGSAFGNFSDYKQALNKHWFSYNEYAKQYEIYKKTEEERNEYISRLRMAYFYRRYTPGTIKGVFRNKKLFLMAFSKYIHRKWIYAPETSYDIFSEMTSEYDCIVKPCDGKLGKGIFKIYKDDASKDVRGLFDSCVKDRMLVEQCIDSCEELKALHPQSLNTIRVVTVSNKEQSEVFGSVLRMGVGNSVVDNAHAGGIFAQINIKDGTIESDGIDTDGNRYECHPDSNIKLKGYNIPQWEEIVSTCCEAAKSYGNTLMGWDVAINSHYDVEFVEANYGPDFDLMQSPLQVGVKKRIFAKIKEYSGIELK